MAVPLTRSRAAPTVLRGFATVHGRRLETATIVPDDAEPRSPHVVFLHDAYGSLSAWQRFPRDVAQALRCPVLVYSRAGHGHSDAPAGPLRTDCLQAEAQAVLPALLDQMGIERPLLVGHEDGATIALIHAGSDFGVAGIVALSPRTSVDEPAVSAMLEARARLGAGEAMQAFARNHRDPAALLERWSTLWSSAAFRAWTLAPFLARVVDPVVLIQGEDDEQANLADLAGLARALRGSVQTLQLEAVGHSPWQEAPRAVTAAIGTLVERVRRR